MRRGQRGSAPRPQARAEAVKIRHRCHRTLAARCHRQCAASGARRARTVPPPHSHRPRHRQLAARAARAGSPDARAARFRFPHPGVCSAGAAGSAAAMFAPMQRAGSIVRGVRDHRARDEKAAAQERLERKARTVKHAFEIRCAERLQRGARQLAAVPRESQCTLESPAMSMHRRCQPHDARDRPVAHARAATQAAGWPASWLQPTRRASQARQPSATRARRPKRATRSSPAARRRPACCLPPGRYRSAITMTSSSHERVF